MDTKAPIFPLSQGKSYIVFVIDALRYFVVTAPQISSKGAIQTLLHHWVTKFGPHQYLVTGRGTEYINQDITHLCSLFNILNALVLLSTFLLKLNASKLGLAKNLFMPSLIIKIAAMIVLITTKIQWNALVH